MAGLSTDSSQGLPFGISRNNYEGIKSVIGGFLIHVVLGTLYLWGNITTAVTSYIRRYENTVTYNQTLSVFASALFAQVHIRGAYVLWLCWACF
jgi:hypothetical protein